MINLLNRIRLLIVIVLALNFPEKILAQAEYFTINDLYNLSSSLFINVYDIRTFANSKGYYSDELQGTYKDDYGNELSFYKFMNKVYINYKIKATAEVIKLLKTELDDECNFWFTSNDGKTKFYTSPNGRFQFSLKETSKTWNFSVNENVKGDPSPAYELDKNKIEINSYTNYANIFIKKGSRVYLKTTGTITFGPFAGSGGPEGIDGYEGYCVNPDFKHGALIGKIGENGSWFLIGSYKSFVANSSGKLYITVNDNDPSNNEDSFEMEYGINRYIKP